MSELKMSDAFVLPVSSHKGDLFNSKNPIGDTRICKFFNMNQFESAKLAAHAINSHDKLVEENKRLREALVCIKNSKDTYDDTGFEEVLDEIDNAIEAALQRG